MQRDWMFVTERWRPVPSFPAYEVSDEGNVRRNGRALKRHQGKNDYWYVQLWNNGVAKYRTVHGIVAEAFLGPRPKDAHVSHLDGTKDNAWAGNLAYETASENQLRRREHGNAPICENNPAAKLTNVQVSEIKRRLLDGETQAALGREFGVTRQVIWFIAHNKYWKGV